MLAAKHVSVPPPPPPAPPRAPRPVPLALSGRSTQPRLARHRLRLAAAASGLPPSGQGPGPSVELPLPGAVRLGLELSWPRRALARPSRWPPSSWVLQVGSRVQVTDLLSVRSGCLCASTPASGVSGRDPGYPAPRPRSESDRCGLKASRVAHTHPHTNPHNHTRHSAGVESATHR
jgi:hypothetical protein